MNLADIPAVGKVPSEALPNADTPVVVLTSQMGSGKSLGADRHFQAAIDRLLTDGGAPVPVWLTATGARGGLLPTAKIECDGIGDPRLQGATIIVDGLDEAGVDLSVQLLNEARELAVTWPSTTVLLTSRPAPHFDQLEESRPVPELDDEGTKRIIDIGAGYEVPVAAINALPDSLRHSLRRPLFALLYGIQRREQPAGTAPRSRGELLAYLGSRVSARIGTEAHRVLRTLAVQSVERELGPVPVQELGSPEEVSALMSGGLVVSRPGGVAPGLPVIAQWFAAQALLLGEIEVGNLLARPEDIDLWLYPLAIAVATGSQASGAGLLEALVRSNPGFALRVIDEALGTAGFDGVNAPPWREAGRQMRGALQSIADSLGDLSRLALPVDRDGRVFPIAVSTSGSDVSYAIWEGNDYRELVHSMPTDTAQYELVPGYTRLGSGEIGKGSSWAWRWAREQMRGGLKKVFDQKALPYPRAGIIAHERVWSIACVVANRGGLSGAPIELVPLLQQLDALIEKASTDDPALVGLGRLGNSLLGARSTLTAAAADSPLLVAPHPSTDQTPPNDSAAVAEAAFFSDEGLLELVTSIYDGAIRAYEELVTESFGLYAERLVQNVTLPALYVGEIAMNRSSDPSDPTGMPVLTGYFEPLAESECSRVEIRISEADRRDQFERGSALSEQLRARRPQSSRWITSWIESSILELGQLSPSTNLAYSWLWRDLTHTRMVSGTRPGRGREW